MPGLTLPEHEPQITRAKMFFLADVPLYQTEKPCLIVPPAKVRPGQNQPNVRKQDHDNVPVENVRPWKDDLKIDDHGFQVLNHASKFTKLDTKEVCNAYKAENQKLLEEALGAEKVVTWGLKQRMPHERDPNATWDYWNEVEVEKPAILAHCDFTYERGLVMVETALGKEETKKYLDEGYRIRIVNTWRPLVPVIERQPLAICDPRSVQNNNLIKCDRILVDDLGEITLLQHHPEQKWYWLESQTTAEPFIFCTWDSNDLQFPDVVRHSPHVTFNPPNIREDAPPRFSVESRSVVVTKD